MFPSHFLMSSRPIALTFLRGEVPISCTLENNLKSRRQLYYSPRRRHHLESFTRCPAGRKIVNHMIDNSNGTCGNPATSTAIGETVYLSSTLDEDGAAGIFSIPSIRHAHRLNLLVQLQTTSHPQHRHSQHRTPLS